MSRELHDHFFREAKRKGYVSRAAFKLIEIDERRKLLRRGDWVLDAGCAPGSWLQVIAERVAPERSAARGGSRGPERPSDRGGRVVGIDLKDVDARRFGPAVRVVQGDIAEVSLGELLGPWITERPGRPPFDAILSDMGPDTTGDRSGDSLHSVELAHVLLDRAPAWLRPGGNLVAKVYEGGAYPELLRRARESFADARGFKPDASRAASVEIYIVCKGYSGSRDGPEGPQGDRESERRGDAGGGAPRCPAVDPREAPLPRRRRPAGWSTQGASGERPRSDGGG
ncbi:MAG TPA: RlmE family RNA methyltransferase [Phycisphaerales bacterium]|nr:RlmE family RNA methyltransferase [Phycisphaerales bacterium]HMP38439.1 RlmE family RNA methyltransferase [Phycisphaerales bacterium]